MASRQIVSSASVYFNASNCDNCIVVVAVVVVVVVVVVVIIVIIIIVIIIIITVITILLTQYCAGGKIETNEMGRACGAYGGG